MKKMAGWPKLSANGCDYDSPIELEQALFRACDEGHVHLVKDFIRMGVDVNARNLSGDTPLLLAVYKARPSLEHEKTVCGELCDLLIRAGADVHATVDRPGNMAGFPKTAMHFAAIRNAVDVICFLHEATASIECTELATSPLMEAAQSWSTAAALKLLELGADPHRRSKAGRSAFDLALESEQYVPSSQKGRVLQLNYLAILFMAYGVNLFREASVDASHRAWPLHQCARIGHAGLCERFMKQGFDPMARNEKGETAIDVADNAAQPQVAAFLRSMLAKAAAERAMSEAKGFHP